MIASPGGQPKSLWPLWRQALAPATEGGPSLSDCRIEMHTPLSYADLRKMNRRGMACFLLLVDVFGRGVPSGNSLDL